MMEHFKKIVRAMYEQGIANCVLFGGANASQMFEEAWEAFDTERQVKNIAVLDGVSVTSAVLRDMAEELHQKLFYREVKGAKAIKVLADKSALERVAKLLEERS